MRSRIVIAVNLSFKSTYCKKLRANQLDLPWWIHIPCRCRPVSDPACTQRTLAAVSLPAPPAYGCPTTSPHHQSMWRIHQTLWGEEHVHMLVSEVVIGNTFYNCASMGHVGARKDVHYLLHKQLCKSVQIKSGSLRVYTCIVLVLQLIVTCFWWGEYQLVERIFVTDFNRSDFERLWSFPGVK